MFRKDSWRIRAQLQSEGCVARGSTCCRDQAVLQACVTSVAKVQQTQEKKKKKKPEGIANMRTAHGEEQRLTAPAVRLGRSIARSRFRLLRVGG